MITIVFDDSNLNAGAVMYLDSTDVQYQGANVWRTYASGSSPLSKFGIGVSVTCGPVNNVNQNGGHVETLNGLNELEILIHAQKASLKKIKNSEIFKGSTLGGHVPNAYSYIAMLLKEGMKDRFGNEADVHSGVIAGWGKANLISYITKVRNN